MAAGVVEGMVSGKQRPKLSEVHFPGPEGLQLRLLSAQGGWLSFTSGMDLPFGTDRPNDGHTERENSSHSDVVLWFEKRPPAGSMDGKNK